MAIHLLVDGARLDLETFEQDQLVFRLDMPAREIRLISGHARASDAHGGNDHRRLGVGLRGLCWRQSEKVLEVPVDSPALIDGFHAPEFYTPEEGLFRWTNGNAALPPDIFPPWHGETLLHLPVILGHGGTAPAAPRPEAALLSAFENLGANCELAWVQQQCGVELPLTLLRWAGTTYEKLLDGLKNRFNAIDDPGTTEVLWHKFDYKLHTPYLNFHTTVSQQRDAAGVAEILDRGRATVRLLRRKLLKDIGDARRIFVYASDDPAFGEAEMYHLHRALRAIGPASLLCVTLEKPRDTEHPAARLADGLYAGYLKRFVLPDGPVEEWLALCSHVLTLHFGG